MQSVAEMLQRNPVLVLVLLVGLPSLPWAAAYGRRPSRARRRVAVGALGVMALVAALAIVEAVRAGVAWWPAVAVAAVIGAAWTLLFLRRGR
jgi:hypothetical protein